jgi:DNA polymerase III gamma/tau subunit
MVGNEAAINAFKKSLTKKNHSHAYILSGQPGTGKTTFARIAASMLGAEDMDVREINTSSARGIDTAREIIQQIKFNANGDSIVYILDECFQKDTPIKTISGSKKISDIKIGDIVCNAIGTGTVKNVFKNKVYISRLCKVNLKNYSIYTTTDHLFFTNNGLIKAKDLSPKDFILSINCDIMNTREDKNEKKQSEVSKDMCRMWKRILRKTGKRSDLFKCLLSEVEAQTKKDNIEYLCRMWERVSGDWEKNILLDELFRKEQNEEAGIQSLNIYERNKIEAIKKIENVLQGTSRICKSIFGKDEEKQSFTESRNSEKDDSNENKERNAGYSEISQRRKWETNRTSNTIAKEYKRNNGVCYPYSKNYKECSELLQGGYWIPENKTRNRGGWWWSFRKEAYSSGQEKRELLEFTRVESIEIYKQGDYDKFGWGCLTSEEVEKGFTEYYDIEVSGHHSYFANNILVHNCHKFTNDMQNALLKPLEDYPEHVYFFLCTTEPNKLIKAIKSRCTEIKTTPLTEDQISLVLKRVIKLEKLDIEKDIVSEIAERSEGSSRNALVMLEQIANAESKKDIKIILDSKGSEDDPDTIELCRTLLNDKAGWGEVSKVLKKLKEAGKLDDSESVRYMVLGYANAVLLNGRMMPRAAVMLEAFSEPTYNTGKFGITLACINVIS